MVLYVENGEPRFNEALLDYVRKGSIEVLQSFFQNDNSQLTDSWEKTLLHYAAEYNNVSMTQFFINNKYNLDSLDYYGNTPLMLAVHGSSVETAELLIKAGADIYVRNSKGKTILPDRSDFLRASEILFNECKERKVQSRYRKVVKSILEKIRNDCWNDEKLLLSRLADIDCSIIKVIYLGDANLTRIMLENGYLVNESELKTKKTALHEAVKLGDYENVKVLLEYGADVDALDEDGVSAIYSYDDDDDDKLSKNTDDKIKILKILIEHGALLTLPPERKSPSQFILSTGKLWALKTLMQYDYEWDPNYSLYALVYNDDPDALEIVRGKRLDVNSVKNPFESPVLWLASMFGKLKKVQFLLESGANPNIVGKNGDTPFTSPFGHIFQHEKGHFSVVRLMLQYGADAQYLTQDGRTVFDIAIERQHEPLLEHVIDHLAMMESLGETITDLTRIKINSRDTFKIRFEICKEPLERMKNMMIHESVSLYKLLTEGQSKVNRYARNPEFSEKFKQKMKMKEPFFANLPYYSISIRERVGKAINLVNLRKEAVIVMNKIIAHRIKNYHEMLSKIVDYLNSDDLKNICRVCNVDELELLELDTLFAVSY